MFFFSWIREQVKQAVLAGVSDAATELGEQPTDTALALASLRERLALPAPAEPEGETKAARKKAS